MGVSLWLLAGSTQKPQQRALTRLKYSWTTMLQKDTLGSAKGWAAGLLFSDTLSSQFTHFKNRTDTFSLGVCNGCQLMALLGWIDPETTAKSANKTQIFLDHNASERYIRVSKGWAAGILFQSSQFAHFKNRTDTFSLGVCNGLWLFLAGSTQKPQQRVLTRLKYFWTTMLQKGFEKRKGVSYNVTFDPSSAVVKTKPIRLAVLREEGTNGDREMIASLIMANFDVFDVTMSDLQIKKITLDAFQGLVFTGGFSYADTLGSAKGWAAGILFSDFLNSQFAHFKNRTDTFSLGVCNGCQLMALLGWIDPETTAKSTNKTQIFLDHNVSERFECRWSAVKIPEDKSDIWFRGMGDSVLGVWVVHGAGRFTVSEPRLLQQLQNNGQVAMQYVDDDGVPTDVYLMNPYGSPAGIAGLRSRDGRHVAMMPHPERCVLQWQCAASAAAPAGATDRASQASPWTILFQNAYCWTSQQ